MTRGASAPNPANPVRPEPVEGPPPAPHVRRRRRASRRPRQPPATAGALRLPRRQLLRRARVGRDSHADAGNLRAAAEPATSRRKPPTASTGSWLKIHGQLRAVPPVDDRALRVGHHAAHDGPAHEQPLGVLHRHAIHELVLGEDRGRRAFDDEQAAVLDELVEVHQAFEAHPAANVIGLILHAEVGRQLGLLVRHRVGAGPGDAVDHRLRGAADVREHDHVVLRPQVAFAQLDVAEVGVGHAVDVEGRADPALVLRARPRVHVADARHVEVVRLDGGRGAHRPRRQAEVLQCRLERRAIGVGDDERPGAELVPGQHEVFFRRQHLHPGMREAERHHVAVARVIDDEHRARALDASRRLHVGRNERHRLSEHALVRHGHQPDVPHQLHGPAGVVVRPRVCRRVVLQPEATSPPSSGRAGRRG